LSLVEHFHVVKHNIAVTIQHLQIACQVKPESAQNTLQARGSSRRPERTSRDDQKTKPAGKRRVRVSSRDVKELMSKCQTLTERWSSLQAVNTNSSAWGDEVEYLVFRLNHEAREVHLSLRGSQILSDLKRKFPEELFDLEACKYMLESQPRRPYDDSLRDLALVESDMRERWVNIDAP